MACAIAQTGMTTLTNRYDFVLLFDVSNGNPNGDPDAGNMPRLDPETNQGLVTDVCLKRKVRNYLDLAKGGEKGFSIYVQEGAILNEKHRDAYKAIRLDNEKVQKEKTLNPQNDDEAIKLRMFMCGNFFDVRTFGVSRHLACASAFVILRWPASRRCKTRLVN
jgi:CRISPR-associated protein Csd2